MILKTFINQYGLMIYESRKCYILMFNGLYLKLNCKNINLNDFDSIRFYEMINRS